VLARPVPSTLHLGAACSSGHVRFLRWLLAGCSTHASKLTPHPALASDMARPPCVSQYHPSLGPDFRLSREDPSIDNAR
jgi:hypothetical protein